MPENLINPKNPRRRKSRQYQRNANLLASVRRELEAKQKTQRLPRRPITQQEIDNFRYLAVHCLLEISTFTEVKL